MISVESWPQPAVRVWVLAQRFRKFLIVGAFGLLVNQASLATLHDALHIAVVMASPIAIFLSMILTFMLNERWTWHDRGTGRLISRAMTYLPINVGGLLINWGILYYLNEDHSVHYLAANLVGAGVAAVWNFLLNHAITWRT
ncbi:MAG TPA: GtrA family protein [Thermomicrobiales bacterium]|nr:GtrA family protein [Thermomicrobiales bacterium]